MSKNLYFVSLGCPKNRVDSEVMLGSAEREGYQIVAEPEAADVLVVNTCGFIDAAREESIDTILELAQLKQGKRKLVVTGCLSQRYPEELTKEIPEIDLLLGSADFRDFPGKLGALQPKRSKKSLPVVAVSDTPSYIYDHDSPRLVTGHRHSVYVKIAEGCDRPCAFCIIPKLRGPQRSRSIESIVTECETMAQNGALEVNLIAQDLTRYGADLPERPTLAALLKRLARIDALRWIRLHYAYPSAVTDELISVIAGEERIVPYVDVPLQHIDDQLLKLMRRGHSARVIRDLVDRLKQNVPGLVLRTTFIVGHPGETDESFERLYDFVRETEFDRVGTFTYSTEQGTHSATLGDTVPHEIALERQRRLMELQQSISKKKLDNLIGRELDILVDGPSEESELVLAGRFYGQAPGIDGVVYLSEGEARPGQMISARVTAATEYDLMASLELEQAA